jgi:hypothetical protein
MGLWDSIGSALSGAISKAISSSKNNSNSSGVSSSGNPSGTYHADGSFTPASSGPSNSPNAMSTALRDYLDNSNVPEQPQGTNIDAYLDAIREMGNTSIDPDLIVDKVMARMPAAPAAEPTLSYDEAQKRAQDQLNPLYDETLNKSLEAVDKSNIRRGFFGQLPGAALERSTAADIGNKKITGINTLANNMVGQSESNSRANQALAQQAWGTQTNALLSALQHGVSQSGLQQNQAMNLFNAILGVKALEQNDKKLSNEEESAWLPWLIGN